MDTVLDFLFGPQVGSHKTSPPLHPLQKFHKFCARIAQNDPLLTDVLLDQEMILDMDALLVAIESNVAIQKLRIIFGRWEPTNGSYVARSPKSLIQLCDCLYQRSSRLTSLSFSGTSLPPELAVTVARCLLSEPFLKTLNLSRCDLTDEFLRSAASFWRSRGESFSTLSSVNLGRNYLCEGEALAGFLTLLSPFTEVLVLECNKFSNEELGHFFNSESLNNVEGLDLSENCLSVESTPYCIEQLLVTSPKLSRLVCSRNDIPIHGLGNLFTSINHMDLLNLTHLSLDGCGLNDEAALAIAHSVAGNMRDETLLHDLNLSRNRITSNGAIALLMSSSLTRHLDLSRNRIASGPALLQALSQSNPVLELLDLRKNCISSPILHQIDFWLHLNKTKFRRMLASHRPFSLSLWALVFARAAGNGLLGGDGPASTADFIFFMIRNNLALVQQ